MYHNSFHHLPGHHYLHIKKTCFLVKQCHGSTVGVSNYVCLCASTGCGEHLIRTMLARECSTAMQAEDAHQALLEAMQNKFIGKTPTIPHLEYNRAPLQWGSSLLLLCECSTRCCVLETVFGRLASQNCAHEQAPR